MWNSDFSWIREPISNKYSTIIRFGRLWDFFRSTEKRVDAPLTLSAIRDTAKYDNI